MYLGYIHLIIVFISGPALVRFKPSSHCCTFTFVLLLLYLYLLVLELLLGVVHFFVVDTIVLLLFKSQFNSYSSNSGLQGFQQVCPLIPILKAVFWSKQHSCTVLGSMLTVIWILSMEGPILTMENSSKCPV